MRSKFAILSFLAGFFRNGVGLLLGVFATPIILKYLGDEQFGIFRVLIDWFGHLSLLEFGLYGAILSFLSKILVEKKEKLGVALQLITKKYTYVLGMQLIFLFIFACFFKYLVPVSPQYASSAWWAFAIMSINSLFIYTQIFRAYLEASQQSYKVSYILVAQNVMYLALAISFVYLFQGVVGQVIAYTISLFFMFLLCIYVCKELLPLFKSKEMLVQEDLNVLKKQRKNIFLNDISGRLSFMSDNIIVTFMIGAKSVTAFYLTQRLAQIVQQQVLSVGNASWAALGELYYKNQRDILSARIVQLTELTAAFSGIALGTLILMNKSFMYLWTGPETYSGDVTTYLVCINSGIISINSLWGWCMTAINRSDKLVPVFFTQAIINIIGSFVLTYLVGVNGPLMGTFLALGSVGIWWNGKIIAETFSIPYNVLMSLWVRPFLAPIVFAIAVTRFYSWPLSVTWIGFFAAFGSLTIVFSTVVYFVLMSKRTKTIFIEKIREFVLRKI